MRPPLASRRALLAWTRRELARLGTRPKRKLSQNFIIDPRVVSRHALLLEGCKTVLEVGGGLGTLTAALSDKTCFVVSVEIDDKLLPALGEVGAQHANIDAVHGDVLSFNGRFQCVAGNIPYSITGPFFAKLVMELRPRLAALTVQKEVADRLAARPGTSAYGRLTVLVQLAYSVELRDVIPPSAFYPPPEVYSRLVVLRLLDDSASVVELRAVEEVTRCMFSERNKKASKVYRRCCAAEPPAFLGERRVYELEPREFLELARVCTWGG